MERPDLSVPQAARKGSSDGLLDEVVLDLLDGGRRRVLAVAGQLDLLARLRCDRPLRLNVVACASVLTAFLLSVTATLPMLAVAPVLFGVPHLASDVRYLLMSATSSSAATGPGLSGQVRVGRPAVALLLTAALLGLVGAPRLAVLAGALAVLWAGLSTGTGLLARAGLLLAAAAAAAFGVEHPRTTAFLIAQGHNVVALGLAAWMVRRSMRAGWVPALLVATCTGALALGACDRWLLGALDSPLGQGALRDALALVVPPGAGPLAAPRWVALFAFAQAVHYSAWLQLVPDAARASARPVSFRRSFQLLCADLGRPGARLTVLLCLALPAAACLSLDGARRFYLAVAGFHVFVELAFIAALIMSRPGPGPRP